MSKEKYHLSKQEQSEVETCVPHDQINIQVAFKAIVEFVEAEKDPDSKNNYGDTAVALSEHLVTICGHKFLRLGYKAIAIFHVNDIMKVERKSDDTIIITTVKGSYTIISPVVTRFSERLLKNYILANPMMPESFRFPVFITNQLPFPNFTPPLSPFKQFQLTYNANCSYYHEKYHHDIPRYFCNLIRTRNPIFDFTQLPFNLIDSNLRPATDIRPIAAGLQYNHFISGITCHNITRDDLFTACAPIIKYNTNLKIVRIICSGATSGAHEIASAMRTSTKPSVIYWDFSNNQLDDFEDFAAELSIYSAPLVTLRLNHCSIASDEISTLINSMIHNQATHHIKQLALLGSTLDEGVCSIFDQFLADISADGESELMDLEIGPVKSPKIIIDSLNSYPIDLEILKIINTSFDDDTSNSFVEYLKKCKRLKTLDLSGCTFTDSQLASVLSAFVSNEKVDHISLTLNQLEINGDRYAKIMPILVGQRYKFEELYLVDNGISLSEPLIDDLGRFRNLNKLSLALNYNKRMSGIGRALTQFIQYYNLKSLDLSGDGMDSIVADALANEAIPFISELNHNCDLEEINMFGNMLSDDGILALVKILHANKKLTSVNCDGNHPTTLKTIFAYLDVIAHSKNIMNSFFPAQDIYALMTDIPLNKKEKVLEKISRYRLYAQNRMLRNRLKNGIVSKLPFVYDKTLDKILDEITLEMNDEFDRVNNPNNQYVDVTRILGLPAPYEDELDPNATSQLVNAYQEMMNQKDDLTINRPHADKRLEEKGKFLLMKYKIKQLIPPNFSNIDDNVEDSDDDLSVAYKKHSSKKHKGNEDDEEFADEL